MAKTPSRNYPMFTGQTFPGFYKSDLMDNKLVHARKFLSVMFNSFLHRMESASEKKQFSLHALA